MNQDVDNQLGGAASLTQVPPFYKSMNGSFNFNPVFSSISFGTQDGMVLSISSNGLVTKGPAFTTMDEASLLFLQRLQEKGLRLTREEASKEDKVLGCPDALGGAHPSSTKFMGDASAREDEVASQSDVLLTSPTRCTYCGREDCMQDKPPCRIPARIDEMREAFDKLWPNELAPSTYGYSDCDGKDKPWQSMIWRGFIEGAAFDSARYQAAITHERALANQLAEALMHMIYSNNNSCGDCAGPVTVRQSEEALTIYRTARGQA